MKDFCLKVGVCVATYVITHGSWVLRLHPISSNFNKLVSLLEFTNSQIEGYAIDCLALGDLSLGLASAYIAIV